MAPFFVAGMRISLSDIFQAIQAQQLERKMDSIENGGDDGLTDTILGLIMMYAINSAANALPPRESHPL